MPFAPIVGINGHGRTIVFGWALLQDESADTFTWLFETFMEVMKWKKPGIILTDQDAGMKAAVPRVFPDARHRVCLWHIFKNVRENMSGFMATRENMEKDMMKCLLQAITVEEFEERWEKFVVKYKCAEHAHIKRMWGNRTFFVPAYFQGLFCPFIRSTSRSESFNSNFKDYIRRKDTIKAFMQQYVLFQENVIHIENQDRFLSNEKTPVFWSHQPVERHASAIYTRGIYLKFLTELVNVTAFRVIEIEKDKVYDLKKHIRYEKPEFTREMFRVNVDLAAGSFDCFCGKFQRDGIVCCHILRLFMQFDITHIPDKLIVERWTISFREKELEKCKKDMVLLTCDDQSHNAVRYAILMSKVGEACSDISKDSELSKELLDTVAQVHSKYLQGRKQQAQVQSENSFKDPPVGSSKSVNKGERLKPQSEKKSRKKAAAKKKTD